MATWEDGPEYAPVERPDAFTGPPGTGPALEAPAPPPAVPPAPADRPVFADPTQAVPPLESLVPLPPEQRDPAQPFAVVASVMTAESSAWASAHWAAPPSAPAPSAPAGLVQAGPTPPADGQRPFGPPTPYAWGPGAPPSASQAKPSNGQRSMGPAPTIAPPSFPGPQPPSFPPPTSGPAFPPPAGGQPFPPPGYPPNSSGFPAPGTPQWFVPGAEYPPPAPRATPLSARAVLDAATPGVLITLAVGGFIWLLAPVTLVVAFVLSSRMTYGRKVTRTAFAAVLAFLGVVGLLALLTADGLFSQWWETLAVWACFASWVMIITAVIAVGRALKLGRPDPPPVPRGTLR